MRKFPAIPTHSVMSKFLRVEPIAEYWHLEFLGVLLKTLKPKLSIEVGVSKGEATAAFSEFSEKVIAIDMDTDSKKYISRLKNVHFMNLDSWSALEQLKNSHVSKVDFCFIDGNHVADVVFGDFERAYVLMSEQGLILLHDTYPKSEEFVSSKNEWCGSAYLVPEMIRQKYPELDLITIPSHPGITIVQKRISRPQWMKP
jgi:predicted O-methyltransferase YrrM